MLHTGKLWQCGRALICLAALFSVMGYAIAPTDALPFSTFRGIMDNSYSCPGLMRAVYRLANPEELGASHEDDNLNFISLTQSPESARFLYLHLTLKVLKPLNDRVFAGNDQSGKDEVNTARNLYRILFSENVMANSKLAAAVVGYGSANPAGRFMDFKSKEWAFDPEKFPGGKERLKAEINAMLVATGLQFDQVMRRVYGNDSELVRKMRHEHGLVSDFTAWHLAGLAQGHPDLAAFAARNAASDFVYDGGAFSLNAREFSPEAAANAVERIENGLMPRLYGALGPSSRALTREDGVLVLSREAIEILRKVDAANFEEYFLKVSGAFEFRLGVKLSAERVRDLRDYLAFVDRFSPSIRMPKREQIDLSKARHGKVSVDFAGQNVENLYQTAVAVARAFAERTNDTDVGTRAIHLARAGEAVATRRLEKLKANFFSAAVAAGLGEVKYSGDDGEIVLTNKIHEANWRRLFVELSKYPEPLAEYRIVHTPPILNGGILDPGAMSRETVKAEEFEKNMRNRLFASIPYVRMKQLAIASTIDPNNKLLNVVLPGNWSADEVKAFRNAAADPGAMPAGYRISGIAAPHALAP